MQHPRLWAHQSLLEDRVQLNFVATLPRFRYPETDQVVFIFEIMNKPSANVLPLIGLLLSIDFTYSDKN